MTTEGTRAFEVYEESGEKYQGQTNLSLKGCK